MEPGQLISGIAIDTRKTELYQWASMQLRNRSVPVPAEDTLLPVSDDASFRRYFRFTDRDIPFIFVDAPPQLENSKPFVTVARLLFETRLHVPEVFAVNLEQGFMMLSDLGDTLYLSAFESDAQCVSRLIDDALAALLKMQTIDDVLPPYDQALLEREMDLFPDWFLQQLLGLAPDAGEQKMLDDVYQLMVNNALQQPQVFVHRDFHSRNLMVVDDINPGIIDFQDAVIGPITYDLVSLLRDNYFQFPAGNIGQWVDQFRLMLLKQKKLTEVDPSLFRRWFDLMGLQRHLKCAGIFSRLHLRDGKTRYLADIPLVITYMQDACAPYRELDQFSQWLQKRIVPRLTQDIFKR